MNSTITNIIIIIIIIVINTHSITTILNIIIIIRTIMIIIIITTSSVPSFGPKPPLLHTDIKILFIPQWDRSMHKREIAINT